MYGLFLNVMEVVYRFSIINMCLGE